MRMIEDNFSIKNKYVKVQKYHKLGGSSNQGATSWLRELITSQGIDN